jgi:oligopeptide/dipeptide ABC transporter ATP-binding protein
MTRVRGSALKRLRRQVQLIFQNPYESLDPRHSVATAVTEPLRIHGIGSRSERSATARELLEAVGLAPAAAYLDRLPHELSGGQRQRVAIARAMALRPSVLVADEPVSMLDASIRSSVLNLMLDLRERFGIAILFVSHDLASARYMSKRALVMYRGQIVEEGPTDDVVATPAHPYTRMLIAASSRVLGPAPAVSRAADRPPACRFAPRCPLAQPVCWTDAPPMVAVAAGHAARCHFALDVLHGRGAPS